MSTAVAFFVGLAVFAVVFAFTTYALNRLWDGWVKLTEEDK